MLVVFFLVVVLLFGVMGVIGFGFIVLLLFILGCILIIFNIEWFWLFLIGSVKMMFWYLGLVMV